MSDGRPEAMEALRGARARARGVLSRWLEQALVGLNRLRLPGASVLPVAGAVVGLYGGLAAGVFANLIGLVSGLVFGWPQVVDALHPASPTRAALQQSLAEAHWHGEYLIIGVPAAGAALLFTRFIRRGGARDVVRKRLRILALLALGALSLYYPLVALAAVNNVFGHSRDLLGTLGTLPPWARLWIPALGGAVVGRLLQSHPHTRGHGVPEVVAAVQRDPESLTARRGLRKLVASALTIGTGGSAGREGPIVYGGAAFGSAVGRTLGFTRRELSVLLAAGAGAGIAASFNTPIGGAIFALEIILREFELNVFSPIFLASVTATMVSRGVMGNAAMLQRVAYELRSGWEIIAYAALGLFTGLLAYAFIRLLHLSQDFFDGRTPGRLSAWMGRQALPWRAAVGGLVVGALALASPTVWGVGHESLNLATAEKLSLAFLVVACALKLVGTCITLGSGGSGGTFFPAVVIGGMGGGAFGELLHLLAPHAGIHSGAYALVGMGGCVAGFTRGPLTGLMMMYELSGSPSVILPLMVTCTIASALCHTLVERHWPRLLTEIEILRRTPVHEAMVRCEAIPAQTHLRAVFDQLVSSEVGVLPVLGQSGTVSGLVQVEDLRAIWNDRQLDPVLVARDMERVVEPVLAQATLAEALERMDEADLDALPVVDPERPGFPSGVLTRTAVQRLKRRRLSESQGETAMAPTEES
jgi:CIC family chloride channel protein